LATVVAIVSSLATYAHADGVDPFVDFDRPLTRPQDDRTAARASATQTTAAIRGRRIGVACFRTGKP
jgi:hypothetical protein